MKAFIFIILIFTFCFQGSAQKFMAVDVFRLGGMKRFRFYEGSSIKYKLKESRRAQTDTIADMKDSTLFFSDGTKVKISELKFVVINRSNFFLVILRRVLTISGVGFIALDAFNNFTNHESPVFKERVLVIGSSLFVAGQLLKLTERKRVRPGRNNRMLIIDPTP